MSSDAELRAWAEAHPAMPQAVAVLALLAERDELQKLNKGLADRVAEQAELLSRKAERKEVN